MTAHRLAPEELRAVCDPATLPFVSTSDLPPLDGMIGQDRAVSATTFGVGMREVGYNFFVLGPSRTGKTSAMKRVLARAAESEPVPPDYCYVHNFEDPYRPVALELPAGQARALRQAMERLTEECRTRVPRAFEGEEFERRKSQILEQLARGQHEEIQRLEEAAHTEKFVVLRTATGLAIAPAPQGEPLTTEEFAALPEAEKEQIGARGSALQERVDATVRGLRRLEREAREAQEKLVGEVAAAAIRPLIQELREQLPELPGVERYLAQVEADLAAHAEEFRALESGKPALPLFVSPGAFLERYQVNVLVDRSGTRGAPVVFEQVPTHRNLLGRVEHRAQFGALVTDFTLIKSGALHQANGGYLILEAMDVLRTFLAWDALKRAVKSRSIRIEEPLDEWRLASAQSLAPEPIPLSVKVVLIGPPFIYYLLYALDEDFRELFKVKVDFDDSLPRTPEFEILYARFVGGACRDEKLPAFGPSAVAKLIEHCGRLVADRTRLTSRLGEVLDLIRESAFWARQRGCDLVEAEDVRHAIGQKTYRSSLVDERVRRLIGEGTLLITTEGRATGQVNGIAVLDLGDHAFGRPCRITARTFSAEPGVVDIEREAKLGGPVHSKGVMILSGFLAGRYARERPLALSASLAFEQSYEEVEGDSASSAELYALLSSLAGIPLNQTLAVTGSVNQLGEIQPVGGINEKIEGFFDVCDARGLTGRQGVIIPAANVRHLMLREDVVEAVRAGRFEVHAVSTVDEGLALLSGLETGVRGPNDRYPEGSFNAAVESALAANIERLKEMRADGKPRLILQPSEEEGQTWRPT